MTIQEAVELYQKMNKKIQDVQSVINRIRVYNSKVVNHAGEEFCKVSEEDVNKIDVMLTDYMGYLYDELRKEFVQL